jgi:GNAT superfamily N-acetyltransferase
MIEIRAASQEDIPSMVPLIYDLGYPAPDEEIKARLGNIINLTDFKTLLAVTEDDDLAGMIGMCESYAYEHDNKYIRVLALVVCKNYRERGIGKLLMMEAEKWASEINAYQIVLTSGLRDERKQAYAFYQRMGYEIKSSGFVKKMKHG